MVPMNMFATAANFDVANVVSEKKSLPKSKEQVGVKFENVLKKVSHNKESKLTKISEKPKSNDCQSKDNSSLLDLLPNLAQALPEADQEKLLVELNTVLGEMGIALLSELDTQDLAVMNEMIAALAAETAISGQGASVDEVKQIILTQLFNAKPEFNYVAALDEEVKMPLNTAQEDSSELAANISKQDIKSKALSAPKDFRLFEDKVQTKTENSQSPTTDIKKLISTELNRINGVKSSTTPNNTLMAEQQPVINEEETAAVNTVKLESLDTRFDTKLMQAGTNNRPVEVKEIIDQIVNKAELLVKQNASEIKINLKPEFLGKMTIKIAVEEGVLTAKFITDNMQVKHLLESNLNTLRQSLESQGLKVERTEVNVQLTNGGMYDGSEQGRESRWERPESQGNYRGNESEEIFNLSEDIPVGDKDLSSGYLDYNDEGALSFLI